VWRKNVPVTDQSHMWWSDIAVWHVRNVTKKMSEICFTTCWCILFESDRYINHSWKCIPWYVYVYRMRYNICDSFDQNFYFYPNGLICLVLRFLFYKSSILIKLWFFDKKKILKNTVKFCTAWSDMNRVRLGKISIFFIINRSLHN